MVPYMRDKKREFPIEPNPNNTLIIANDVEKILQAFKVPHSPVDNISIYRQAFVHKSYVYLSHLSRAPKGIVPFQPESYETLEFVGDCIVNTIVGIYLFERFPAQDEGFLTRIKAKLVRSKTLSLLAKKIDLPRYLLISKYIEEKHGGRDNRRFLEDIFEAFIGALYHDQQASNPVNAFHVCQQLIISLIDQYIDIGYIVSHNDNYKDQLLKYCQKHYGHPPIWKLINSVGQINNRMFTMGVIDRLGMIVSTATASKKIDAEQLASRNALKIYNEITEDDSEDEKDDFTTDDRFCV